VSRRSRRRREPGADAGEAAVERAPREAAAGRAGSDWGLGVQVVFLAAVFGLGVLVAELAGAANLGVAFGIGQIAFAIAVVYLLLRR
jgi:hypothetical protein